MVKVKTILVCIILLSVIIYPLSLGYAEELLVDNFEKAGNLIGGRSSTYEREPSRSLALRTDKEYFGDKGKALMIKYDKKSEGGPFSHGGWCGYYTLMRNGNRYFDASGFKNITFQVKGALGEESFKVGLADKHWEGLGDSVKSENIEKYLPGGKITTQWQKATVPLEVFFLEHKELASLAICFETECFPGGGSKGTVYIDDLKFE